MTEYQRAKQAIKEAKGIAKKTFKAEFVNLTLSEVFGKHPVVDSFSWTQYTPGFNDGDPCRFGVHADEPNINGEETPYPCPKDLKAASAAISKLIFSFDKEDLEAAFGDGSRVTVARDGKITVEDYDCGH